MRGLMAALGDPQDRYPVIHIAGTNGKGSVAAMVEAAFRAAGWRTGLYTSPHLIRLGERIQVDREPLTAEVLSAHVRDLEPIVEQRIRAEGPEAQPTYFEFMTALAFERFRRDRCDIAIVETGMGGRLDATNVVTPEVSVITSIGLDHTEVLGNSIEAIASEKAGIIKRGRPVVIGRLPANAERVIRTVADAQASESISVAEEFGSDLAAYPRTNAAGDYQRINAATALLVARQFDPVWRLGDARVRQALMNVDWPARWQRMHCDGRLVIIDAAHNAEGAGVLEQNLAQLATETRQPPVVVVGVLGVDRAKPILEAICRHAREIRLVVPHQRRACSFEQLEALIPSTCRDRAHRTSVPDVFPEPGVCLPELDRAIPVVITGSIYLAGEALAQLDPTRGPVEHELQDF